MKTIKQFFYLVSPFWGRRAALYCWFLLIVSLTLTLSSVWFNVKMNEWNGGFYNALQQLDGQALYKLLQQFVIIIAGLITVVVMGDFLRQKMVIRWREGMTEQVLDRWLSKNSKHYMLRLTSQEPDNPDQRIAEDIRLLIESTMRLTVTFLHSLLTLISFATILWSLSGALSFTLGGSEWTIPGYMFWACIIYTIIGITITQFIGSPLRKINMEKQRKEADYRTALITRKQHGDAIAGQRGEISDRNELMGRFLGVIHNWNNLIRYERNLAFFTVGYQQATAMAPIIFALPKFLAGELMLGGLMQLRQAFSSVAGALSWFIFSYKEIAAWQATVTRLYNFVVLLEHDHEPEVTDLNDKQTKLKANLSLFMQDDSLLIQDINLSVKAGELTIIEGCSGLGKSTLLRALSGHWPYFKGEIQRSPNVCWLPQRMYLPFARLDSLLAYPCQPNQFSAKEYQEALHLVGLDKIKNQLSLETDWTTRLSGGEQQRLIFARLLLNKPELILLDETTSALDEQNALNMLMLLKQHLPTAGIALVSHQRFTHVIADNVISLNAPSVSSSQPAGAAEYVS
ncbi:ABC transporter ATP-binding protein/permease [Proteus hauseri]|uniref:ABC transporter ATP-binding protein/permease n=1 Tax=Proteus cibi TaxID=2050966 RepID=UPI000D693F37|nr:MULTISPECIES: ABC transporter ATP-binding protein/permease [Proteus]MBG6032655.1 ABC transporter ATP-binding protein/permease [Proteus hauseri]MBS6208666.1 ABC transporter ATP-binding protein/permease [Proteus hauseri]